MSREIQWYNQQVATLSGPDADVAYLHLVVSTAENTSARYSGESPGTSKQ